MKKTIRVAGSLTASLLLVTLFFFLLVRPARAPTGGKQWTGGRTISSLQEDDFDRRLLKLQLCHGVRLQADQCTPERRRVCKALVVHELELALSGPGEQLNQPLEFVCEDTALGEPHAAAQELISLQPNRELESIRIALSATKASIGVSGPKHERIAEACEFLTQCRWALRAQSLSMRRLASCLATQNSTHRRIFLNELGSSIFGAGRRGGGSLYARLTETPGK